MSKKSSENTLTDINLQCKPIKSSEAAAVSQDLDATDNCISGPAAGDEKNQSGLTTDSVKNHEISPESCSNGQANPEPKGTNSGACASSVCSSTEGQANSGSEGFNAQEKLATTVTVPTVEPSPKTNSGFFQKYVVNTCKKLFSFQSDDDDHDEYVHCSSCGQKLNDIKRKDVKMSLKSVLCEM